MKNRKSGTTMVEVIVAVMIVSIVMAMFARVVDASVRMYHRSAAIIRETEAFNETYYKSASIAGRSEVSLSEGSKMELKEDAGHGISIALPRARLQKYEDPNTGIVRYSVFTKTDEAEAP